MPFLKISLWIGLLLFLPHGSHQFCFEGKPEECLEADFAPGTDLGGEGFDVTKMELKELFAIDMSQWEHEDKTCTLCSNPYLENKKQKLPLSVVDWRAKHSCSAKVNRQLHKTSVSLLTSSTTSITNNWKNTLDISMAGNRAQLMLAGSHSKIAKYSMEKTKTDKYVFSSQSMSCEYYSFLHLHIIVAFCYVRLINSYSHASGFRISPLMHTFECTGFMQYKSHYILERGLWKNCSTPCPAGVRTDAQDPCVCQCHNNTGVNQDCCPTQRGLAWVIITVQRATDLFGDCTSATDGYVKVYVNKKNIHRSKVILNNDNPQWRDVIDLGTMDLSKQHAVRFEVWDENSNWSSDLLGECERALTSGVKDEVCSLQHGQLSVKWQVQCAPSLTGNLCTDYKPTPMNPNLKGWFKSRNVHPVPEAMLREWGVFRQGQGKDQSYSNA
ncbi:hypothetical protein NL108_012398 [Boleophthalmus pectinirostris]|nr:hypothetical protein NL108_012398 [Boleophthalmus pectinirostris]